MQQAFCVFAGFTVYHVKTSCTSFGSSYGRGEDMSKTTTKAEHTSFIVLFFLCSDTRQPFHLDRICFG